MKKDYYNWEEICRKKSDKELYRIYKGKTLLDKEATGYALRELERRDFKFDEIDKYKKKWELEDLIDEAETEAKTIEGIPEYKLEIVSLIFGLAMFIALLIDLFIDIGFIRNPDNLPPQIGYPLYFILSIIIIVYSLFRYRDRKRRKKYRDNRIKEIINGF
jgi:hypothetical protein